MGSAKRTNRRALHSIRTNRNKRKLSTLRGGGDEFLVVFIPPEPSTNFIAGGNCSLNPTRPPCPNQENRRVSIEEEFVAMNKVLEKVRARLRFLESVPKQNAEKSSNQGGDPISSSPTVVGDAALADQC